MKRLLKNNEYKFRVMAVSKFGVGVPLESKPVVAKNPYNVPGIPAPPKVNALNCFFPGARSVLATLNTRNTQMYCIEIHSP